MKKTSENEENSRKFKKIWKKIPENVQKLQNTFMKIRNNPNRLEFIKPNKNGWKLSGACIWLALRRLLV